MRKRILTSLIYRLPFLIPFFLKGKGFVFMLHRILPKEETVNYEWNKGLSISPEGIAKWVSFFRSKGFDIISMDEVYKRIKTKKTKPFVAFTMDDGYKDNFEYGLPVLEKLDIPCTIYVSNCFPNNFAIYWWYFLEDYIKNNSHINLNSIGVNYQSDINDDNKKEVYDELRELLRQSSYSIHKAFAEEICGIQNLNELNDRMNLTWKEVKELSDHPLITIGGHTLSHVSLKNQPFDEAQKEIVKGTEQLVQQIGRPVTHFAYPYGSLDDVSKHLFVILKKQGYKTAVLNHPGSMFYQKNSSIFDIPRMGLTDETTEKRMEELLSGKLHLNFNGLKHHFID